MKLAIPVDSNSIESKVCMSFGRAPYYLIHDTESKENQFVLNTAAQSAGGAGVRAAQIVADQKVDAVLTPRCGQNAAGVLLAAKARIYRTKGESIKENIDAFLEGKLSELDEIHAGLHRH
ncbi:MAG TPA: NifB/NifX family molybdenum-iron cluster-binding protein [Bacillota bacterium]|jgi:predicted Fe-Mo cluster-binding NifX family protein|nr:dinitrogenase iron-molybdenum cofactor biosynthesis protein [Fastidiosipila sp.]HPX93362.1 NifB/NifX family molybdenum-iron cluster-binding protein [Bacillota bacterium]HQB80500.1 NifB/NifX family molybdenum-iron cluster-binding protein [Bacillota bacterium]